jgi:hypothetical protein
MDEDEKQRIRAAFRDAVNMAPAELQAWLETQDSRSVGWTRESEDEAVGHASGRRIVAIKRARQDDFTEDDYGHMNKVVGYVRRHLAQRPKGDVERSRWRYSLMNWGHDPLKD